MRYASDADDTILVLLKEYGPLSLTQLAKLSSHAFQTIRQHALVLMWRDKLVSIGHDGRQSGVRLVSLTAKGRQYVESHQ